jgi:metal-responsive CopG/Arc/MetJ family transcriptional regulator
MKRTTIFADDEMLSSLRQIAQQEGLSVAEIIRQALNKFIAERQGVRRLPSVLGIGHSGRRDIADRCEELLWSTDSPNKKTSS